MKKNNKNIQKGELTEKNLMFCKEFIVDFNGTQAAIRAGFSQKTARQQAARMLSNVNIQKVIAGLVAKRSERVEVTADYVIGSLVELNERCLQRVPVMVRKGKFLVQAEEEVTHPDGSVTTEGVWKFDSKGANSALRSLGDHLGLYKTVLANDKDNPLFPAIAIIRADKLKKGAKK